MVEIRLPEAAPPLSPRKSCDLKPGAYYWGVSCHLCGEMLAIYDDEPHGAYGPVVGAAKVPIGCTECDSFPTLYSSNEFINYRVREPDEAAGRSR